MGFRAMIASSGQEKRAGTSFIDPDGGRTAYSGSPSFLMIRICSFIVESPVTVRLVLRVAGVHPSTHRIGEPARPLTHGSFRITFSPISAHW